MRQIKRMPGSKQLSFERGKRVQIVYAEPIIADIEILKNEYFHVFSLKNWLRYSRERAARSVIAMGRRPAE